MPLSYSFDADSIYTSGRSAMIGIMPITGAAVMFTSYAKIAKKLERVPLVYTYTLNWLFIEELAVCKFLVVYFSSRPNALTVLT